MTVKKGARAATRKVQTTLDTLTGGKAVGVASFNRTLIEDEINETFSLTLKPEKERSCHLSR